MTKLVHWCCINLRAIEVVIVAGARSNDMGTAATADVTTKDLMVGGWQMGPLTCGNGRPRQLVGAWRSVCCAPLAWKHAAANKGLQKVVSSSALAGSV